MKAEFICVNLRNLWISSTSLLFRRWHLSSRVVALLTFLLLVVVNLPGNVSRHVAEVHGMGNFALAPQYEHGWPMTHIVRQENSTMNWAGFRFADPTIKKCWQFWSLSEQDEFHVGRLAGNVAIGLAITILAGCLFEIWRRRHQSLFQIHLLDVGLAVTGVAALLGWYVAARSAHEREEAALSIYIQELNELGILDDATSFEEREKRGLTWMRLWIGDKPFEVFDRIIVASPLTGKGVPRMAAFRELRKTHLACRDLQELEELGQFRQLEDLHLTLWIRTDSPGSNTIRLPPLRSLRVLTICSYENRMTGLDQLANLRVLNLQDSFISTETLKEISRLKNLKQLSIAQNNFPPDAIKHLISLAELEELDLSGTPMNDAAVNWLGDMSALKKLSLQKSSISEASLNSISRCESLESLSLDTLSEAGLQTLSDSPRLHIIIVSTPEKALCWQKSAHDWRITGSIDGDSWIFSRAKKTATVGK